MCHTIICVIYLRNQFTCNNIFEWREMFILLWKMIQDIHQAFTNLHQMLETIDKHMLKTINIYHINRIIDFELYL